MGYRRAGVVLQREGWDVNIKKTHLICNELGLRLRNKTRRRRVKTKLRDDRRKPMQPNETWAMDFVHNQFATGKKIQVLTVADMFFKFAPLQLSRRMWCARLIRPATPSAIWIGQGSGLHLPTRSG
jgi:putative transposase